MLLTGPGICSFRPANQRGAGKQYQKNYASVFRAISNKIARSKATTAFRAETTEKGKTHTKQKTGV